MRGHRRDARAQSAQRAAAEKDGAQSVGTARLLDDGLDLGGKKRPTRVTVENEKSSIGSISIARDDDRARRQTTRGSSPGLSLRNSRRAAARLSQVSQIFSIALRCSG